MNSANDSFNDCPCSGRNLAKLIRPAIMALLKDSPRHGYELALELQKSGWCGDSMPDTSGIYRILADLELSDYVRFEWQNQRHGAAKKVYYLTSQGEICLKKWHQTLKQYLEQLTHLQSFITQMVQKTCAN
ncbi:MAG: PadR family transcriptional regulator [Planctomycetia bacterium]|nr:PadR family transcriptional regulator [Planctomycetia bacterium]